MKCWTALPLLLLLSTQAQAGNPRGYKCGSFDTSNTQTASLAVAGGCAFTTGPAGVAFITAEAEVTCNGSQAVQLWIGSGTATLPGVIQASNFAGTISGGVLTIPTARPAGWYLGGANFTGSMSGNTLTVSSVSAGSLSVGQSSQFIRGAGVTPAHITAGSGTSWTFDGPPQTVSLEAMTYDGLPGLIFGFGPITTTNPNGGNPPWLVQQGQTLTGDGMQAHPGVTITGQLTSTETGGVLGGAGTYSISDPSLSTQNTTNGFFSLFPIPSSATASTPVMHESGCNPNFIVTSISTIVTGPANTNYWLGLTINTDTNGSLAWSSWVNSQMYILVY